MSKEEVERNEEGLFKTWLRKTDAIVERWQGSTGNSNEKEDSDEEPEIRSPPTSMPRSTTYFERNIEVWRQLCVPRYGSAFEMGLILILVGE